MNTPILSRRPARLIALISAIGALTAASLAGGTAASADSRTDFPGAKASTAHSARARSDAAADTTVEGEVNFSLRDKKGAQQLATLVSTPGNALYGKPITPARWIARFSPSQKTFDTTLAYLKKNHLTITGTPKSRLFITFRGTVDQLEGIFSTDLRNYTFRGKTVIAPATTPSLPTSAASGVGGLYLGTLRTVTRPTVASAPASQDPVSLPGVDCSHYWQEHTGTLPEAYGKTQFPTANCGYLGSQFRSVYGASASMTGAGQKVAIVDAYGSPTLVKDYATFAKRNGGSPLTSSTYRQILPKKYYDLDACTGVGGWQIEQVLDVTAVHGIAPKARIQYVGGFNCSTGIDVAVSRILDDKLATIVSNSYGYNGEIPLDYVQATEAQVLQAAAEGIGMYFSSGDLGDNSTLPADAGVSSPSADYPATSPWVTAVGGTTTEIGRDGTAALETGWGNYYDAVVKDSDTGAISYQSPVPGTFNSGSGGGISALFGRPYYQDGTVTASGRGVPDVAAVGDPRTGELVGYRQYEDETGKSDAYTQAIYGGTSLSSPLFAAEVALVQQKTHRVFGFLNPLAYGAYQAGAPVFRDVLPTDVAVAYNNQFTGLTSLVTGDMDTSYAVTPGWDQVTGLGVLKLNAIGARMR